MQNRRPEGLSGPSRATMWPSTGPESAAVGTGINRRLEFPRKAIYYVVADTRLPSGKREIILRGKVPGTVALKFRAS